jgi:hypothetical protein
MRIALPNARIMVHQPSGGRRGMASDIEIQAREILRIRKRMNELYVKYTGRSLEEIEKAMDRDTFLEATRRWPSGWSTRCSNAVLKTTRRPRPSRSDAPGRADRTAHRAGRLELFSPAQCIYTDDSAGRWAAELPDRCDGAPRRR